MTTETLYRRKVAAIRTALPALEHVLLVGDDSGATEVPGTSNLHRLMDQASESYEIGPTAPEDPALLHFTSGTTGTPKGALHVHDAVVAHHVTGKLALDLHPDDVSWCTADPGWVTGTSYGIIAPLTSGVDEGEIDAERWYGLLQAQRVTVRYTAPTAIRMLMKAGLEPVRKADLRSLRFLASVGEPLNPKAVTWGATAFGHPVPRQLVADRDRRDHDRRLRGHGGAARLDGPTAARDRGGQVTSVASSTVLVRLG